MQSSRIVCTFRTNTLFCWKIYFCQRRITVSHITTMTFMAPEIKVLLRSRRALCQLDCDCFFFLLAISENTRRERVSFRCSRVYEVEEESKWWYYAAAAVSERSRWQPLRRGGPSSWIQAPSSCRWFPGHRKSLPGSPAPFGLWMTALAALKTHWLM